MDAPAFEQQKSKVKNPLYKAISFLGECVTLLGTSIQRLFHKPIELEEIIQQIAFVGVHSVPIVVLTTFFSGAVLGLYSAEVLLRYGATTLSGATIGLSVSREVAPIISSIMVIARCGSSMAAQIATMKVTEQIDALRSLGVHPVSYLVIPRLMACMVMLPTLCLVGVYAGNLGGYLVSVSKGIPGETFLTSLEQYLNIKDILKGMVKTFVFGIIISIVSCQQGLRAHRGAKGVGQSTTKAVIISMVMIYLVNYLLSSLFY